MWAAYEPDVRFWTQQQQRSGVWNARWDSVETEVIRFALMRAHEGIELLAAEEALPLHWDSLTALLLSHKLKLVSSTREDSPFLGEYDQGGRTLILHEVTIAHYGNAFTGGVEQLRLACAAHEFFHALEATKLGDTRRGARHYLGWRAALHSRVLPGCDEIAAHTFARDALAMDNFPVACWPAE